MQKATDYLMYINYNNTTQYTFIYVLDSDLVVATIFIHIEWLKINVGAVCKDLLALFFAIPNLILKCVCLSEILNTRFFLYKIIDFIYTCTQDIQNILFSIYVFNILEEKCTLV